MTLFYKHKITGKVVKAHASWDSQVIFLSDPRDGHRTVAPGIFTKLYDLMPEQPTDFPAPSQDIFMDFSPTSETLANSVVESVVDLIEDESPVYVKTRKKRKEKEDE